MLNDLYHSLDPVAFSAGPITIYWYGIAYIVGAALTGVVMYRTQKRWGFHISMDDLWTVVTCVVFGLLIGARLFYLVFYGRGLEYYLSNPLEIIAVNHGGMSFHGGLVGGIAGGAIACRMLGLSFWTLADLAVIGAPLALCLGRCANFVNGELWGKPTDLPWGVIFESGGNVARHPSQLYEALLPYSGTYYNKVEGFEEMRVYWYQMEAEIINGEYSVEDATDSFVEYADKTLVPKEKEEE